LITQKQTNQYISSKEELVKYLNGIDEELVKYLNGIDIEILSFCMDRKKLTAMDEDDLIIYYDKIISFSSVLLQSY